MTFAANLANRRLDITVPPVGAGGRIGTLPGAGSKIFLFGKTYGLSKRSCHSITSYYV